jgi:hypothetical protein
MTTVVMVMSAMLTMLAVTKEEQCPSPRVLSFLLSRPHHLITPPPAFRCLRCCRPRFCRPPPPAPGARDPAGVVSAWRPATLPCFKPHFFQPSSQMLSLQPLSAVHVTRSLTSSSAGDCLLKLLLLPNFPQHAPLIKLMPLRCPPQP